MKIPPPPGPPHRNLSNPQNKLNTTEIIPTPPEKNPKHFRNHLHPSWKNLNLPDKLLLAKYSITITETISYSQTNSQPLVKSYPSPEKISTPPEKILTPPEKISTPPEKISTPPEKISTPPEKISIPPEKNINPATQIIPNPTRKIPNPTRKNLNPAPQKIANPSRKNITSTEKM